MLSSSEMSDISKDLKLFNQSDLVHLFTLFQRCHDITGSDIGQWVIAYTNPQWSGEPDLLTSEIVFKNNTGISLFQVLPF